MILGTAAYMSPEQARGRPVDKRADVWAFGAVLFEMLTGTAPFPGEDISHILARVIEREPEWGVLPLNLPPAIGVVLRRCLTKDPRQRIRDIGDVRLALDGAFDTRLRRRSRLPPAPTSAVVATRSGLQCAGARHRRRARRRRDVDRRASFRAATGAFHDRAAVDAAAGAARVPT